MIALHYIEEGAPFPPVDTALEDPNGLLAFGGDLSPARLFSAYSQGYFRGLVMMNRSFGGHQTLGQSSSLTNLFRQKALKNWLANRNTR